MKSSSIQHFKTLLIIGILISVQSIFGQQQSDLTFTIHSDILNENRSCYISLPDSYTETTESYPVIILLDGYTFFKSTLGTVQFMSSNHNRNHFMPETIIVAIENIDRERDLTVTKIKTKRPNTMGGGRNFLRFIEKELIPYLDGKYRTIPYRTLIGHSLGGLLAMNAYMDSKSIFNAYLAIDPSIWWDEERMNQRVAAIESESFSKRLYIATANQQARRYEKNKKRHDRLFTLINNKANGQLQAKIESFDDENHRSIPLIAIYKGLQYLHQEQ